MVKIILLVTVFFGPARGTGSPTFQIEWCVKRMKAEERPRSALKRFTARTTTNLQIPLNDGVGDHFFLFVLDEDV